MNPLDELPEHESFYNLDMVFEGLTSLRPKALTALLTSCRKIKVRRLFFVLADRHDHVRRKHLNMDAFDFGTGGRVLAKSGKIHPTLRHHTPGLNI